MASNKKSLRFRRDNRSEEQFKKDIKEHTIRERMLLEIWMKEMSALGVSVSYVDNGVDNSGEFVEESNVNPDYCLTINGVTRLTEIKQNPFHHRNSFKVYDLETYIKLDADILLFYGLGKNIQKGLPDTARWAIISPESMKKMLELPRTRSDFAWGNKEIVIVWMDRFDEFFESKAFVYVS